MIKGLFHNFLEFWNGIYTQQKKKRTAETFFNSF